MAGYTRRPAGQQPTPNEPQPVKREDLEAACRRLRDTPFSPRVAVDIDAVFAELTCLRRILSRIVEAIETSRPEEVGYLLNTLADEIRERITAEGS